MDMYGEITDDMLANHIEKLREIIYGICDSTESPGLSVLVGQNGTGKSFIRKQVNGHLVHRLGMKRNVVREISMQMRTELKSEFGALSTVFHDSPYSPTSLATFSLVQQAMGDAEFSKGRPYYLFLDELEIGLSKESLYGMLHYLTEKIPGWLDNTLGITVITHSDIVVQWLAGRFDLDFYNLGYNTLDKDVNGWLAREIMPTDFEWLDEWSGRLCRAIQDRLKPMGKE